MLWGEGRGWDVEEDGLSRCASPHHLYVAGDLSRHVRHTATPHSLHPQHPRTLTGVVHAPQLVCQPTWRLISRAASHPRTRISCPTGHASTSSAHCCSGSGRITGTKWPTAVPSACPDSPTNATAAIPAARLAARHTLTPWPCFLNARMLMQRALASPPRTSSSAHDCSPGPAPLRPISRAHASGAPSTSARSPACDTTASTARLRASAAVTIRLAGS